METSKNISWEAQEYVSREKNVGWYIALVIIGLCLIAGGIWFQWWSFSLLIVVSVIALIVYSVRPPRMVRYMMDSKGVKENNRRINFEDCRAFGVINDGGHFAIVLTPRKRFSPRVWIYFPEQQGEKIVDAFGARLPMEEVKLDFIDRIVRTLRI